MTGRENRTEMEWMGRKISQLLMSGGWVIADAPKKKLEHVSEDEWAAPKILVEHSHQPFKVAPRAGITVRRIRITKTPASSTIIRDIKIQPLARWRAQRWRSRRQSDCASGPGVAELRKSEGGWWQAKGGVNVKNSSHGAQTMCLFKNGASCDGMQANRTM